MLDKDINLFAINSGSVWALKEEHVIMRINFLHEDNIQICLISTSPHMVTINEIRERKGII